MKKILFLLFISCLFYKNTFAQVDSIYTIQNFKTIPHSSIRALAAVSESKAWFAANRGILGYTEDAGKTFHIDSIKVDSVYPEFRSIAVLNDSTVLLLSIQSPAYLFKTTNKGKTWRVVYKNTHKDIFFDSMNFSDQKNGIAVGDPIEGVFQLINTKDGGETWTQIDPVSIPKAEQGEGCFATSNSNIELSGKNIWFVSGGKRSRIFHSNDMGKIFKAYEIPLPQGEIMTGAYTLDFFDSKNGVIGGGNYDKKDSSTFNLALTSDGGKTWKAIKNDKLFFGSCVQFRNANELFVSSRYGTFRYTIKNKKLTEIKDASNKAITCATFKFTPSGKAAWFAGGNGHIALLTGIK